MEFIPSENSLRDPKAFLSRVLKERRAKREETKAIRNISMRVGQQGPDVRFKNSALITENVHLAMTQDTVVYLTS